MDSQIILFEETNFIEDKFTIDELLKRSWRFKSTPEFVKFFNFIARFNHYSRFNTMLVYVQDPSITFFGGIPFWKKSLTEQLKRMKKLSAILSSHKDLKLICQR